MSETIYISELAGHCNEVTAWRILKEASQQLIEQGQYVVSPSSIAIADDGHFALMPTNTPRDGFDAPQSDAANRNAADAVWSLGATLFYVVMGRQVMNGKGGKGQTASSKLPYLRSKWPEMSKLVQQCLQYDPALRPTLHDILDKSTKQYERCLADIKRGPKFKPSRDPDNDTIEGRDDALAFWPDNMESTTNQ